MTKMQVVTITFPDKIDTQTFESVLLKHLAKTRLKSVSLVRFDFSNVQWCDLFELSLLIIWISNLREKEKHIEFVYPLCTPKPAEEPHFQSNDIELIKNTNRKIKQRQFLCSYLNRWDFDDFLREQSVTLMGHDQSYPYWPLDPEQDSILPFRFFRNELDFSSFLSNISDAKQLEIVFRDTVSLSVIGSGGLRDTIIREIGQNIYDHAEGKCAFITVGIIPPLEDRAARQARYKGVPELEKPFFRNLGKSGYLQVVIADHGPGIMATLRSNYNKDSNLSTNDRHKPLEHKVVEYAFRFDATRRKQRSEEGTGLYWVREVVLQNYGFLSVRTGSSILRYDFLTNQTRESYKCNLDDPTLRKLADLGGTQFKFYFPLNPDLLNFSLLPSKETQNVLTTFQKRSEPGWKSNYKVIELRNSPIPSEGKATEQQEADRAQTEVALNRALDSLFNQFPHPHYASVESWVVLLDFAGTSWTKETIVRLLERVAVEQHERLIIVGINSEHISQIVSVASDVLAERVQTSALKIKPILFVKEGGFEIIGLPERDRQIVKTLSQTRESGIDRSTFVSRYNHLFKINTVTQQTELTVSIPKLRSQLADHYKKNLQGVLLDELKGIFYSGKYFLPSNSYVNGYFRINSLLASELYNYYMDFFVLNSIIALETTPNYLITLSNDIKETGKKTAEKLAGSYGIKIRHIHLTDARNKDQNTGILIKVDSPQIVILTSVIGTGFSLESVLDVCQEPGLAIKILKIINIVDARDSEKATLLGRPVSPETLEYRGQKYQVDSVLVHPLRFYNERPTSWRREDIRRIDPKTNAPNPSEIPPATRRLWQRVNEFFLENIVQNTRSIQINHHRRRHRHYIYFFDMARIATHVGPEIAAKIRKDVQDISAEEDHIVRYIIFDEQSRGAKVLAKSISSRFSPAEPLSIQMLNRSKPEITDEIKNKDIVLCMNAVASGGHLQRFIHNIAECAPRRIYAYVIIHRNEGDSVPFYQMIDSYSGVETRIRYFVDLEIPVHSIWDCPACIRRAEVRQLRDYCDYSALREFLERQWEALEPQDIDPVITLETPGEATTRELVQQARLRRQLSVSKRQLQPLYGLIDILDARAQEPDPALRLLEVLAREIIVLKPIEEQFSLEFFESLKEACISFLQAPKDSSLRERFGIYVLRHISPESFIDNLVPIFRGTVTRVALVPYFFTELMSIIKSEELQHDKINAALSLCQSVLERDEAFADLPTSEVVEIGKYLNYFRRRLRMEDYRIKISHEPWEYVVSELWSAFVNQPGRVHPKLIQSFAHVIGIHSAESFKQIYDTYYDGPSNFADSIEEIIPAFTVFANCLRTETRNNLAYFLTQGKGTFSGDCEILDESLRSLDTLRHHGKLTDEAVDKSFYNNPQVNFAIDRLDKFAFSEDSSLIRQALIAKFTELNSLIDRIIERWKDRFDDEGIHLDYTNRQTSVFVPEGIIDDVIDSFIQNTYRHAFDSSSSTKLIKLEVDQQIEYIVIRISDTGKGISEASIEQRPNGGIRRSEILLTPYGGEIEILLSKSREDEFATVVEIRLLSKEGILA